MRPEDDVSRDMKEGRITQEEAARQLRQLAISADKADQIVRDARWTFGGYFSGKRRSRSLRR
ncbi:MAG: hypothetical protein AAB499_02845, partial [Patescibacteria group bacterium]